MKMSNEEAVKRLEIDRDTLGPYSEEAAEVYNIAINAIEKVEAYEKMMDELLEPKYGDYIQHKFTHEYGDVVTVEDLRYTFGEYRRDEE